MHSTPDASVLVIPLLRFLPGDDPRVRRTVLAIADEVTVDELVLRYRVDETDDGLAGEERTLTICSFWLVSALVAIGEEIDPRGGLALITAVMSVLKAERKALAQRRFGSATPGLTVARAEGYTGRRKVSAHERPAGVDRL